jgi:3-oxoadipate enol-lactonase
MTTTVTLASTLLAGGPEAPLLLVGPSLGTSGVELWSPVAAVLGNRYRVVAWDLPGHGASPAEKRKFSVADIAAAVVGLIPRWGSERTYVAGVSLGGAVTLTMQLEFPGRAVAASVICSGARIGEPAAWRERAAQVRSSGTASLVAGAPGRWFSPEVPPALVDTFSRSLADVDDVSYARCCEALAEYRVTDRLDEVTDPVLALWGEHDRVTPEESAVEIASGVAHGTVARVSDASHLAPVEQPAVVAGMLDEFFGAAETKSGHVPMQTHTLHPSPLGGLRRDKESHNG